ncbi:hypothetical protein [Burkholderia gladioli]|uniref:hypothetical protein n=1 Tax=Burkholderia gladioli TaxID=28095 RepID=UPI00163ECE4F|nr:hypothetical protein [Burkholderia gladioli]
MDSCNGTHRPRLKRNRLLGADSARYLLGAAFGAAVFASVQFAVNHRSEIEVARASVDVGAVHLSPEAQLAMRLSDGYNFSRKMAENAVSPGKDALVYVEYQGRSVWSCEVRVGYQASAFSKATAQAETPERACAKSILSLNKDGAL